MIKYIEVTPDEIAERCAVIQSTWTEATERKRRGLQGELPRFIVQTIHVDEEILDRLDDDGV